MRGPYERLKYDLRRGWECPQCHRKVKTEFTVTSQFCSCTEKTAEGRSTPMRLTEDGIRRVWQHPRPIVPTKRVGGDVEETPPAAEVPSPAPAEIAAAPALPIAETEPAAAVPPAEIPPPADGCNEPPPPPQ